MKEISSKEKSKAQSSRTSDKPRNDANRTSGDSPNVDPQRKLSVDAARVAEWWLHREERGGPGSSATTADQKVHDAGDESIPFEIGKPLMRRVTRGLPAAGNLKKLAAAYAETQARLWPALVEAQLLEAPSATSISKLAVSFAEQFICGTIAPWTCDSNLGSLWSALGTSYVRYSSGQQNPRSLDDQLVLQLNRARSEKVFIPWRYVCADAGITGRVANRTGYNLCKSILHLQGETAVSIIFIDEIARATRDGLETIMLGDLVSRLSKRMIGVSDNFDSQVEFSRTMLHFYAMFNEQFLTQHRQKVIRGKDGAARRGTILGRVPIGYKKVPALDSAGHPMRVRKGTPAHAMAVDEVTKPLIERLASMLVDERKSLNSIALEFNRIDAAGKRCWTAGRVRCMLQNELYAGIFIYHRSRHVKDPLSGRTTHVIRPRSEWKAVRYPHLKIWNWKTWKMIQARLKEIGRLHTPGPDHRSLGELYPVTLLRGNIFCGYCGSELKLFRSNPSRSLDTGYRQLFCRNGREGKHECLLWQSKSVRMIETSILSYVRDQLLTEDSLKTIIENANAQILLGMAAQKEDDAPLRSALSELKARRDRLIEFVAGSLTPDLRAVRERITETEREIRTLSGRIGEIERGKQLEVKPITAELAWPLLTNIRSILNQDVAGAAPVLRKLLGPIRITLRGGSEDRRGKKSKQSWIASFRPTFLEALVEVACEKKDLNCPDPYPWVNLTARKWTMADEVHVSIDEDASAYRIHSAAVHRLAITGMALTKVAKQLHIHYDTAREAYLYAIDGMHKRERQRAAASSLNAPAPPPKSDT